MTVYIVTKNEKIVEVFTTEALANAYKKEVGGWNVWKIIPAEVKDRFQPKLV